MIVVLNLPASILEAAHLDSGVLSAPTGALRIEDTGFQSGILLSVVIPTFNEKENIRDFLAALQPVLETALPDRHEVIVIDDDSPDGTWRIAAQFRETWPALRVVRRTGERGLASAVIRGWQTARGEILGTINGDFQHPPEVLGRMIEKIAGSDVVVASRYCDGGCVKQWTWHRRFVSRGAYFVGRLLLPKVFSRVTDPLSGCYIFRRSTVAGIELKPMGYKSLIEIMARGRVGRVAECDYRMRARRLGESKVRSLHWFQYIGHLLRLRLGSAGRRR